MALHRSAAAHAVRLAITAHDCTPWASATFIGSRHRLTIRACDAVGWLTALPEAELSVPGYFVADIKAEDDAIEALILEA